MAARAQQAAGRPLVRFADIPLEWSDFRLTLRQTADILRRFDALERRRHEQIVALGRDGNALEPLVSALVHRDVGRGGRAIGSTPSCTGRTRRRASTRCSCSRCARSSRAAPRRLSPQIDLGELESRPLSDLRMGARFRGDHAGRRSAAVLRTLRRAVELRSP